MRLHLAGQDCEIAQHIDALRESEHQFRTLADNMSQLAWTASPRGQAHWYNERWYAYTGTSLEAMKALGWRSLLHPEHRERVLARLQYCFSTGSIWEDTFPLRGKDGAFNWFLSRALPMRDAQGHITHWLGTHTDITAQVSAEEALRELKKVWSCALPSALASWQLPMNCCRPRSSSEQWLKRSCAMRKKWTQLAS
ncbi:Signal transduction histidine kinase [Pseudomonas amygdali pv. myricae]|nr:Signal transduction histidine kinase [Pseudomonas amygdali pv. myricae]RMV01579.1 Signal transduction histidine kinase [Pseudomonas amygdali pv. myricae]RMV25802.1 Signal transduction histidine kinase [Pseudomonas amygdali pv. myricae]